MTMLHTTNLKKQKLEKDHIFHDHLADSYYEPSFLLKNRNSCIKFQFLKRISPFIIVEICLPVLLVYSLIKNNHALLFFFLFMLAEATSLTIDFALWNYHAGHKIWRIWLIEIIIIFFTLSFII
jgi:hypothetical protein